MGTSVNVRALGVVLAASSALVLGVGVYSTSGNAASPVTANMPVKLTVEPQCTVTANELNFGTVSFLENSVEQDTTFRVRCSKNVQYSVRLLAGNNFANGTRKMKHSSQNETIAYSLYQDSGRTIPWDPNASVDKTKSGTVTYDVFGTVPSQPGVDFSTGTFQDTVTIQVDY